MDGWRLRYFRFILLPPGFLKERENGLDLKEIRSHSAGRKEEAVWSAERIRPKLAATEGEGRRQGRDTLSFKAPTVLSINQDSQKAF